MANVILIRDPARQGFRVDGGLGAFISVTFDATVSVDEKATGATTKNPIEDGASVSDHVVLENPSFSFSGVLTDTSLVLLEPELYRGRAEESYSALLAMRDARDAVSITWGERTFTDLVITDVSRTSDASTGGKISVSMAAEQIRKVSLQSVRVPPEYYDEAIEHSAGSEVDAGNQTTEDATEDEQPSSWAYDLEHGILGE